MKLKKGDKVIVIAGKNKGQKGSIEQVISATNKVIVGGVNKAKIHIKPTSTTKGSIVERDMPLHASNVMIVDTKTGKQTRVASKVVAGKKIRIAKKSNEEIK